MLPQRIRLVLGLIATILFGIFIFGLSHSISTGFAGFIGGLPFMCIAIFVLGLALYNLWEDTSSRDD